VPYATDHKKLPDHLDARKKLTPAQRLAMQEYYAANPHLTWEDIAKPYNVGPSTARRVCIPEVYEEDKERAREYQAKHGNRPGKGQAVVRSRKRKRQLLTEQVTQTPQL
jgi:hypothetical protein